MISELKDKKVLVVCGGFSSEREISLLSGNAVYSALKSLGYEKAAFFDLNRDNANDIIAIKPDIVFIALHGRGGEDGSIQGLLEFAGIPYTGSGICSCAICLDKVVTKKLLVAEGLPTAKFSVYRRSDIISKQRKADNIINEFGLPVVLKSPSEGSSIGIVIVRKREAMLDAMDEVLKYGDTILAEEYLDGTEVTLPVLGNESPQLLPIVEIVSEHDFYDYESKYTTGTCHHIIPACISSNDELIIKDLGLRAYKLLKCQGFARVDYIVDKVKGPMIIEVNSLPGLTSLSLFPDSARYMGMSFETLVERILFFGCESYKKRLTRYAD